MKKLIFLFSCLMMALQMYSQTLAEKLKTATNILQKDTSLAHAILSLYVADSKTGETIFSLNGETGLAPASTQKIFTSIAAFDLLGKNFTYKTTFDYTGDIKNGTVTGNIIVKGYGDPSFGSLRFTNTKPEVISKQILNALQNAGIKKIDGDIIFDNSAFDYQPLPGGWVWDDIGNYYGAGTWAINCRENQYDLLLKPGKKFGDTTTILETDPILANTKFKNHITTAGQNDRDNGYIYLAPFATNGFTEGSIPAKISAFTISGSLPEPAAQIKYELNNFLVENNIEVNEKLMPNNQTKNFYTYTSPPLDSLVYWFLQKSINLYGEAFLKTIAYKTIGLGSTTGGVDILKNFWLQNGIENSALNICDGSGLSPANRVTTHALTSALLYAQKQSWFSSFYNALPTYNGIKMKSGSIGGVRSFAGYISSGTKNYSFAIIVNNYSCGDGAMVQKLYKVLDKLK